MVAFKFTSCFLLSLAGTHIASAKSDEASKEQEEIIEWVRSKGGYFRPKQELKSEDGLFGVFATEFIEAGELLFSVPWECMVTTPDREIQDPVLTFEYHQRDLHVPEPSKPCDLVHTLANELKLGSKSKYAPYVQSLARVAKEHAQLLPLNWSKEGKALLKTVTLGGVLPPRDPFLEDATHWTHTCEPQAKVDPELHKTATMLVLTHSEETGLVPIMDKYNHLSGKGANAGFSNLWSPSTVGFEVYTHSSIEAGEQIFVDYKTEVRAEARNKQVGTPELLRDYGFVESLPQRWYLPNDGKDVAFDIVQTEDGLVRTMWLQKPPSKKEMKLHQGQLKKLKEEVYPKVLKTKDTEVPKPELDAISKYCKNLIAAIEYAIKDVEKRADRPEQPPRDRGETGGRRRSRDGPDPEGRRRGETGGRRRSREGSDPEGRRRGRRSRSGLEEEEDEL